MATEGNRRVHSRFVPVGPTAEELIDALLIWARPDAPFVVAGAEVTIAESAWRCRWHPIIAPTMGHPIDVLRWAPVPREWFGLGVAAWGTARAAEGAADAAAEAVRASFVLTRAGDSIGKVWYPGGGEYVTPDPVGGIVDACAAALAMPAGNESGRRP